MERVGIQVKSLCYGSEDIEMLLNGERIGFHASYMGQEPLASLVQAVYLSEKNGTAVPLKEDLSSGIAVPGWGTAVG